MTEDAIVELRHYILHPGARDLETLPATAEWLAMLRAGIT
jgi:hypothetical protein